METSNTSVPYLDQLRQEKADADKSIAELKVLKAEMQELNARLIMGGQTSAGQGQEVKKEVSAKDYAAAASKGIILS